MEVVVERLYVGRMRSWLRGEGRGNRGWRGAATLLGEDERLVF
jgi:hypothetical protein